LSVKPFSAARPRANATAAFPIPKGLGERLSYAMGVDSIDVGHTPSTGNFYLRLRFPNGGHLGFNLNRVLAERVHESLANELGMGPHPQTRVGLASIR
jgi:hypothetical protein